VLNSAVKEQQISAGKVGRKNVGKKPFFWKHFFSLWLQSRKNSFVSWQNKLACLTAKKFYISIFYFERNAGSGAPSGKLLPFYRLD
jgi:hypothetical protein